MKVDFWGVCGSVPSPPTPQAIDTMISEAARSQIVPAEPVYYGGNTPCVTIEVGGETIICDMGTGVRKFGQSRFRQILADKKLMAHILMSHVHWDHIQGFPFFGPVYMPRGAYDIQLNLRGGVDWRETLETVLLGQMRDPKFPIDLKMIALEAAMLNFSAVFDRLTFEIPTSDGSPPVAVYCRRLNHPNETYGYRITHGCNIVAYTTDNEGYTSPDPALVDLVRGATLWIQDAQYADDQYCGKVGIPRLGWGHSCPSMVIDVARAAKPERIVTFHHDPDNGAVVIRAIAGAVQDATGIRTVPAREGEPIILGEQGTEIIL
jgi:phosphoribosyl 1,2-cyclic phosphodiesterase